MKIRTVLAKKTALGTRWAGLALCAFGWVYTPVARGALVDLREAVVVLPTKSTGIEKQAAIMLIEETEKRTHIRWSRSENFPSKQVPVILLGRRPSIETILRPIVKEGLPPVDKRPAEGFQLQVIDGGRPIVVVAGNDLRGVMFGVGRLLRELRMRKGRVELPDDLRIVTAPKYPIRGHQLGYRPKTNSYDAWDVATWEQYIRDLIVFGSNAVELIPPRSDDAADSPHFPLPPMEMMVKMSGLLDRYGLDVWIWYPAMDKDYADPSTVQRALAEREEVFSKLPRVDAVFVPGGDPGHTHPKILMPFMEKQAALLRRFHPKAQTWIAPQGFNREWLESFYQILRTEKPSWLTGLVYGPQVRVPLPELRAAAPKRYPIRRYPDITHSRQCQYPVPNWDLTYSLTLARETINPRPTDHARIFRLLAENAVGFIAYSEGCNDDVNKIVWSSLGWDPEKPVIEILREYGRYFIGPDFEEGFARGLLALEENWRGPLLTNSAVNTTLQQFQTMEKEASPVLLSNWRFQEGLYRAYYDAYERSRLLNETALEDRAMAALRSAKRIGAMKAMTEAERILDRAVSAPPAGDLRKRVFELAEAMFQSIRLQTSVKRYGAIAVGRGAHLDTIDMPLNNRWWLKTQFEKIRKLTDEPARLSAIRRIVNRTNPGPGGFYDDLGSLTNQPHLVKGPGFYQDPAFFKSPLIGFGVGAPRFTETPTAWWHDAETLHETPLKLRYEDLDPKARYKVRVVYAGDAPSIRIRLLADDRIEIHPEIDKPRPMRPLEFDVPEEATGDGNLTLTWYRQRGLGGNGRGCQVAEVWLIRKGANPAAR